MRKDSRTELSTLEDRYRKEYENWEELRRKQVKLESNAGRCIEQSNDAESDICVIIERYRHGHDQDMAKFRELAEANGDTKAIKKVESLEREARKSMEKKDSYTKDIDSATKKAEESWELHSELDKKIKQLESKLG